MKSCIRILIALTLLVSCPVIHTEAKTGSFRVLVVMSYEKPEINLWCHEVKEGIGSVLSGTCDIDYFYMDTKINFDGGNKKAKQAYALYLEKKYDGVIAVDDNAQKMFVVPYLKDKVKTPVMFCGVNADPAKYGFPASNVSGIIERGHVRETVALLKQLMPQVKTMGFIVKDSPSGNALKVQVNEEFNTYTIKIEAFEPVSTFKEIEENGNLKNCDTFFIASPKGIRDHTGKQASTKNIISFITKTFGKPVVGANNNHIQSGAFCSVVKTGQEQGRGAAKKLLAAMHGKPVSKIPITRNFEGKRVINVSVMKELGLVPKPISLLGAELVKTNE